MYLLRAFWVYKKVGDSDDVVIEKQGFSIVDTHEPAIAISLLSLCLHTIDCPHGNQIFSVGRHRGVFRFDRPGLHHITSHRQKSLQDVMQIKYTR